MTETQKAIEAEADRLYPDHNLTANPLIYGKRIGYVAGFIAGRSKSLEDAKSMKVEMETMQAAIDRAALIMEEKDSRIRELEEALRGIVDSCEFFADGRKFDGNHKEALKLIMGKAKQLLNNH